MLKSETRRATGVNELVVLRCLHAGERYGYEIAQAIHERTSGEIEMREGQLYPLLHDLAARGYLASRRTKVEGRPRVYYRLTAKGRTQLEQLHDEWQRVVAAMDRILA
ncbi:MAG: helix-turn-helix transcriptional regulator [bacterium]